MKLLTALSNLLAMKYLASLLELLFKSVLKAAKWIKVIFNLLASWWLHWPLVGNFHVIAICYITLWYIMEIHHNIPDYGSVMVP